MSEAQHELDEPDDKIAILNNAHAYQERDSTHTSVIHAIFHQLSNSLLIILTHPAAFRLVRRLCGSEGWCQSLLCLHSLLVLLGLSIHSYIVVVVREGARMCYCKMRIRDHEKACHLGLIVQQCYYCCWWTLLVGQSLLPSLLLWSTCEYIMVVEVHVCMYDSIVIVNSSRIR